MKMRSLFLASMMLVCSLNAAERGLCPLGGAVNASAFSSDDVAQCSADLLSRVPEGRQVFCDALGKCSFGLDAAPEVVEEAVNEALEVLTDPAASTSVGITDPETYAAQALAMLQNALLYAQETGNYYLGEYIQAGLEAVQAHYEENPVATAVVGTVAIAATVCATVYVLRGCAQLMKKCVSVCYGACKSKRGTPKPASAKDVKEPGIDDSSKRKTRLTRSSKRGARSASATENATDADLADE